MYTCYVLTCASFFVALFLLVILIFFLPSLPDAGPHLKSLSQVQTVDAVVSLFLTGKKTYEYTYE